jgi:hypothetical protein
MYNEYNVRKDLNQGIIPIGVPRAYNFNYGIIAIAQAKLDNSMADINKAVKTAEDNATKTENLVNKIEAYGFDDFFDIDVDGGLEPSVNPTFSTKWQLDGSGNIMPA